jgi:hypothetical protein
MSVILQELVHNLPFNRIGAHPVENRFGLGRMQCRGKNACIHFLRAFAHSPNYSLKSPVRCDFSIGRCRLIDSHESIGSIFNPTVLALRFHSILAQEAPPENHCMTSFDVTANVHLPRGPVTDTTMSRFLSARDELGEGGHFV